MPRASEKRGFLGARNAPVTGDASMLGANGPTEDVVVRTESRPSTEEAGEDCALCAPSAEPATARSSLSGKAGTDAAIDGEGPRFAVWPEAGSSMKATVA
jgi:hypothetical protein